MYNDTKETTESVCLLERLDREEIVSDEAVSFTASQEILSTRASMAINGKMLLGTFMCFVNNWFSKPANVLIFVAIACVVSIIGFQNLLTYLFS